MREERITSRKNPLLQQVKRLFASKKEREAAGLFAADGTKLLMEAVRYCPGLETVILSDGVEAALPEHVRLVRVPGDVMESISPMKTPQGVLCICRLPDQTLPQQLTGQRYVVLDGVQDPGNVGTVLRTADAFGCSGLILLPGCADPFGPKTVRASMGAVFRCPVWTAGPEELERTLEKSGIPLYGAALRQDTLDVRQLDLKRAALAIGSEGRGLSEDVLRRCHATIRIPMEPKCESLNAAVAAAILLWEAYR